MDALRAIRTAALLTGLAGSASAHALFTSPASPVTYGTPVTLIALIIGYKCSGDVVQFFSGDFVPSPPPPPPFGYATAFEISPEGPQCLAVLPPNNSTSHLPPGSHRLDFFDISVNFGAVASTILVVNQAATTISLVAAPNPSIFGQNVMLTATVSPATATGTVTFADSLFEGTSLGSAIVSNGVAILKTSAFKAGKYTLIAEYNGDVNYLPSLSNGVNQTVNESIRHGTLPNPSSFDQPVTLTADREYCNLPTAIRGAALLHSSLMPHRGTAQALRRVPGG